MNKCNTVLFSAIAGALSLGLVSAQATAADKPKAEKCYGVAKAGKNDCQTSTNACAGQVKQDRNAEAWIFVPAGTCERISGGSTAKKA